jgi:hypothetical protein
VTNLYRARTPQAEAMFAPDVFERDFTVAEELDHLNSGLIELVPRPYTVLSDSFTIEGWPCPQNAVVTASFPIEIEAALISGGHLERADDERAPDPQTPGDDPETDNVAAGTAAETLKESE